MSSDSVGEDGPSTSSGAVRFYQELGFRAAALSMWRPMDVMSSLSKYLNHICVTGCELCVTVWVFCQAGAISPAAIICRTGAKLCWRIRCCFPAR